MKRHANFLGEYKGTLLIIPISFIALEASSGFFEGALLTTKGAKEREE